MAASRKPPPSNSAAAALSDSLGRHVQPQARLTLALSGGLDSVVLLHLLAEFKRSRRAVESIAARVKIIEGARTQKEARAAQAAAEPKQKKKKVEAAPAKEKKEKKASYLHHTATT